MRRAVLVFLGILSVVLIAGFFVVRALTGRESPVPAGNSGEFRPAPSEKLDVPQPIGHVIVSGSDYQYSPSSITLPLGIKTLLTFKNVGTVSHNLVISELGVDIPVIGAGESMTVEVTAGKAGDFAFYCGVGNHRTLGMSGTVKVE